MGEVNLKQNKRSKQIIAYICGSSGIQSGDIPEKFWEELDRIMDSGDEILLGDSEFERIVYDRCIQRQYENVSVYMSVPQRKLLPLPRLKLSIPSSVKMIKKCDHMAAVWDGQSEDAFLNILMLLALNKTCKLYHLPTKECVDIRTINDLRPYISESHILTDEDIMSALKKCGLDDPMINSNLERIKLHEEILLQVICMAPISLKAKLDLMEALQEKDNSIYEAYKKASKIMEEGPDLELVRQVAWEVAECPKTALKDRCDRIRCFMSFLDDCIFYLFEEWYDADVFIQKSEPVGFFDSIEKVLDYSRREYANEEDTTGEGWHRVEAWNLNDPTWDEYRYDFYIYRGEICWFVKLSPSRDEDNLPFYMPDDRALFDGWRELSLVTPFTPGDIVNIDCRPFGPPFHALILEANDQWDCCMPQMLFKIPFTDKWTIAALKHRRFVRDTEMHRIESQLSPLYRLRAVSNEELTEDDELLVRIGKELNGDEERAAAFWKAWNDTDDDEKSAKEVIEIWNSIKE